MIEDRSESTAYLDLTKRSTLSLELTTFSNLPFILQVFKDGLRIASEEGISSSRYFSDRETRALFTLGPQGTMAWDHEAVGNV